MFSLSFIGFTLDVLGKLMIAYTAVMIHYRFWQERKIDEKVFHEMRREQAIGIVGITLIVIGYILRVPSEL